jgi:hypothetical protein
MQCPEEKYHIPASLAIFIEHHQAPQSLAPLWVGRRSSIIHYRYRFVDANKMISNRAVCSFAGLAGFSNNF